MEIQVDRALQRLAGNKALYLNLALCFPADVTAMMSLLQDRTTSGDGCAAVLHDMKCVASTLGAVTLAQRAAALEKLVLQGTRPFEEDGILAGLEALIDETRLALREVVATLRPASPDATALVAMDELRAMVAELGALLTAGNMRALSIFAKLQYRFGAVSHLQSSPLLPELALAMNRLDFAAARDICQRLAATLSKNLS